jgi:hypothetical protein
MEQINTLLEKYNHFRHAQISHIESPADRSKVIITMVVEDDEGEITNTVRIEFKNIKESRLLQNSVLPFLDMMSGISIVKEHDLYGFAVGSDTAMLHVHNAPLYVVASDISIEEK